MTATEIYCPDCNDMHDADEWAQWQGPADTSVEDPAAFIAAAREAAEMFGDVADGPGAEPGPDAAGESYVLPGWEIIDAYTREQALADGTLVDVTRTAREAGLTFPVAVTRAVWEDVVAWSEEDNRRKGAVQDEAGRLWDLAWMLRAAIRRAPAGDRVTVQMVRTPRPGRVRAARLVELVAVCGPGDQAEPVITVMQPDES